MQNFVKHCIHRGGKIVPVIVPSELTGGTSLFNPSVYYDELTQKLLVNVRNCEYTLYHSEKNVYEHEWGPLVYMGLEGKRTIKTTNYLCAFDEDLNNISVDKIDTSLLDAEPKWYFAGHEDCRLFRWENKLYLSGVRRDTTPNGQGRMELSEIEFIDGKPMEISRFRIPSPGNDDSYCEKNWMPIVDMPYHYVKWTNPTEVVRVDRITKTSQRVYFDEAKYIKLPYDFRGGSQVIKFEDYWIALTHVSNRFVTKLNKENSLYKHHFIVWDKNWNLVKMTEPFDFMGASIEFSAGITKYKQDYIISFGFQDNSSYLLKVPYDVIREIVYE